MKIMKKNIKTICICERNFRQDWSRNDLCIIIWKIAGDEQLYPLSVVIAGHLIGVSQWVSERLLLNANSAIFQLYHGENKLVFNEMKMTVWETTACQLAKGEWKFRVASNIHFILAGLASNSCKASRNFKTFATITGLQL